MTSKKIEPPAGILKNGGSVTYTKGDWFLAQVHINSFDTK